LGAAVLLASLILGLFFAKSQLVYAAESSSLMSQDHALTEETLRNPWRGQELAEKEIDLARRRVSLEAGRADRTAAILIALQLVVILGAVALIIAGTFRTAAPPQQGGGRTSAASDMAPAEATTSGSQQKGHPTFPPYLS
jgi:hypothetical protein